MSSAPTDCRVPDPTDAKADGNFGNHRAGYGSDRLQRAEAWARKGYTLAAGEGLVLCSEIDRLRTGVDLLKGQYDDAWKVGMEAVEKMRRLERILAALRNPSDVMVDTLREQIYGLYSFEEALKAIRAAVAAAEREVDA